MTFWSSSSQLSNAGIACQFYVMLKVEPRTSCVLVRALPMELHLHPDEANLLFSLSMGDLGRLPEILLSILSAYNEWPSGIHWVLRMTLLLYYWALQMVSFFFSPYSTCELCWACFADGLSTCSHMPVVKKKGGPSDLYRVSIPWLLLCFTDIKTEVEATVPWAPPVTYS